MSPAGCTKPEEDTHIGFDRRPRLPFLPMTGVPKCSGLVRGSLSSVCTGDKWQHRASVPPFQTIKWKTKDLSSKPGKKSLHAIPSVKNGGIYPAWKYNIKKMDSTILTSLSAKWRAPFRQREERLRVFSSPSSNTADMTRQTVRLLYAGKESTKHTSTNKLPFQLQNVCLICDMLQTNYVRLLRCT